MLLVVDPPLPGTSLQGLGLVSLSLTDIIVHLSEMQEACEPQKRIRFQKSESALNSDLITLHETTCLEITIRLVRPKFYWEL